MHQTRHWHVFTVKEEQLLYMYSFGMTSIWVMQVFLNFDSWKFECYMLICNLIIILSCYKLILTLSCTFTCPNRTQGWGSWSSVCIVELRVIMCKENLFVFLLVTISLLLHYFCGNRCCWFCSYRVPRTDVSVRILISSCLVQGQCIEIFALVSICFFLASAV